MDTDAIAGSDACGMKAGRQFANENQSLVSIDGSLRPDRIDIDLEPSLESAVDQ